MRKLVLVLLGAPALALTLALAGCSTRPPPAPAPAPQPYTRIANPNADTVQLQIAIRQFVPARHRGPAVWLAAVMHVGEPDYYRALQHFLDAQTVVLYEGINPESRQHHAHEAASASHASMPAAPHTNAAGDYSMQSTLAHSLGLVFQLDAIDYDRANFLNSDLSILQIQRIMAAGQPPAAPGRAGGGNASFNTLLQIMDGSSLLGSLFKVGMQIVAASPELQAMTKLAFIEAVGQLKGDLSDAQGLPPEWRQLVKVLIQARNKNLMADLKAELKKVPRSGSIAIFYGAGHMDDLEQRLTGELHYRPASDTWLAAFSVNLRQSGVSPVEAQIMRSLIKSQLDQMKGF
jgi:hypothetical protein